jgi:hypothetical protein
VKRFGREIDDGVGSEGDIDACGEEILVAVRPERGGIGEIVAGARAVGDAGLRAGEKRQGEVRAIVEVRAQRRLTEKEGREMLDGMEVSGEVSGDVRREEVEGFEQIAMRTLGVGDEAAFVESFGEVRCEGEMELVCDIGGCGVGRRIDGVGGVRAEAEAYEVVGGVAVEERAAKEMLELGDALWCPLAEGEELDE